MSDAPAPTARLLVVDDDARVRQMLARYFADEGFAVDTAADGVDLLSRLSPGHFDVVLLDVSLPGGKDGFEVAREIRTTSDVPIIMLTGRTDVVDRVVGLEIGADDYIAKPFHLREVLARIKAVLRRRTKAESGPPYAQGDILTFSGWQLHLGERTLTSPTNQGVELTTGEFNLLAILAGRPGHVFSRDILMELTHGRRLDVFDRTIDAQIVRLRRKLEADPGHPILIKSVRGIGYVLAGRTG